MSDDMSKIGYQVMVFGLQKNKELNGQYGEVLAERTMQRGGTGGIVLFDDGRQLLLPLDNLEIVEDEDEVEEDEEEEEAITREQMEEKLEELRGTYERQLARKAREKREIQKQANTRQQEQEERHEEEIKKIEEAAAQVAEEAKGLEKQIEEQRRISVETQHREAARREQLRQHEDEVVRLKKNVTEIEKNSEENFKEKLIEEQNALKKAHEQQMAELRSQISEESAAQSDANKQVAILKESYEEETQRLRQEIQRQREANDVESAKRLTDTEETYKTNLAKQQKGQEAALLASEQERKDQMEASLQQAEEKLKLKYEKEKDRAQTEYETQRLQLERRQQELEAKLQHSELQNNTEIIKLKQELISQKREQEQTLTQVQTRLLEQQAEEDQKTKDIITKHHDGQLRQARLKFEMEHEAESKKAESDYALQVKQAEQENLIRTTQLQEREVELQNLLLKTQMESENKITRLMEQLTSIHSTEREEYTERQDLILSEGSEYRKLEVEASGKSTTVLHNEKAILEQTLLQMKQIGQLEQMESSIRHSIITEQDYGYLSLSKHTEIHHISKAKSLAEEKASLLAQLASLKETSKLEGDEQRIRSSLIDEEAKSRIIVNGKATPEILSNNSLAHEKAQLESQLAILRATSQLETEEQSFRQQIVSEEYIQCREFSGSYNKIDSSDDLTLLMEQKQKLENELAEAKLKNQLESEEINERQQLLLDEGLLFREEIISLDASMRLESSQTSVGSLVSHATSTTTLSPNVRDSSTFGLAKISSQQERDEVLKVISVLKKYHGPFIEAEHNYRTEILRAEKSIWDAFLKQTLDKKNGRIKLCSQETESRREISMSENSRFSIISQFWRDVNRQFSNALTLMLAHHNQTRNEIAATEVLEFTAIIRHRKSEAADRLSFEELETNARAIIIREQYLGMQRVGRLGKAEQGDRTALEASEKKPRIAVDRAQAAEWIIIIKKKHLVWKGECKRKRDFQKSQWVMEANGCEECAARFGIFRRKHHCRSCAGIYCNGCSKHRTSLPAWGHDSKVRVCGNCLKYHNWKRDTDSPACHGCGSFFSLIKRRHHCRSCGEIYCNECTRNKTSLLDLGHLEPQRVCETCFKGEQAFMEHRGNSWMTSPTGMSLFSWSELDLCADDASLISTPQSLASTFDPGSMRLAEEITERRKRSSDRLQECYEFHSRRRGSKVSPLLYADIAPQPPSPFPEVTDSQFNSDSSSPNGNIETSQNAFPRSDQNGQTTTETVSDVTDLLISKKSSSEEVTFQSPDVGADSEVQATDTTTLKPLEDEKQSDGQSDGVDEKETGAEQNITTPAGVGEGTVASAVASVVAAEVTERQNNDVSEAASSNIDECVVASAVASVVAAEVTERQNNDVSEAASSNIDECVVASAVASVVAAEVTERQNNDVSEAASSNINECVVASAIASAAVSTKSIPEGNSTNEQPAIDTPSGEHSFEGPLIDVDECAVASAVALVSAETTAITTEAEDSNSAVETTKNGATTAALSAVCTIAASQPQEAAKPRPKVKRNKPAPKGKKSRGGGKRR